MRIRVLSFMIALSAIGAAFSLAPTPAFSQEQRQEAPARNTGGTNANWAPARTPDGQPDFQGYWDAAVTGTFDLTDPRTGGSRLGETLRSQKGIKRVPKPSRVIDPPDGQIPYQPWAAAKQKILAAHAEDATTPGQIDTQARCFLDGATRGFFHTGFKVIQIPGYVVFLFEGNNEFRTVPLSERPHAGKGLKLWMGDSRAHWEGNTLVIDITNLNAKARLDMVGDFYSSTAHVVERLTLIDANTFQYEATIDDPAVYTRPWTLAGRFVRAHKDEPGYEIWEDSCHEGEKSTEQMIVTGKTAEPSKESK